ncbi:MAG: hypothetical protein LUD81_04335 [Clostridiales bacterium]|nr:hypothetical protein [Clostridiales bacterium]
MACFLIPAAEAVITAVAAKSVKAKEEREGASCEVKIPFSRKLKWLSNICGGGSILLLFEHVWHGEIVAWFPFLTAASSSADMAFMLHEMATAGVSMAALATAVWGGMSVVSDIILRARAEAAEAE